MNGHDNAGSTTNYSSSGLAQTSYEILNGARDGGIIGFCDTISQKLLVPLLLQNGCDQDTVQFAKSICSYLIKASLTDRYSAGLAVGVEQLVDIAFKECNINNETSKSIVTSIIGIAIASWNNPEKLHSNVAGEVGGVLLSSYTADYAANLIRNMPKLKSEDPGINPIQETAILDTHIRKRVGLSPLDISNIGITPSDVQSPLTSSGTSNSTQPVSPTKDTRIDIPSFDIPLSRSSSFDFTTAPSSPSSSRVQNSSQNVSNLAVSNTPENFSNQKSVDNNMSNSTSRESSTTRTEISASNSGTNPKNNISKFGNNLTF